MTLNRFASRLIGVTVQLAGTLACAVAQQEAPRASPISASARLAAGKSVFLRNAGGSKIPFDVISNDVAEWGRYTLVDSPEKADLIFEVVSPDETGSVSVSSSASASSAAGQPQESSTTTRELPGSDVKLTIYDARSKLPLWSAREKAKNAMKQKTREDNLVQAAQRLFTAMRERVEK